MATYKAEFMQHYYNGRLRPRAAYSMGLIWWWSRAANLSPWVANAVLHAPGVSALAKWIGGIHQQRDMPLFRTSFRKSFRKQREGGRPVILFPDTFNTHFHPDTAQAAVQVLEATGCSVSLPRRALCCARPLFAWGMLDLARDQLGAVLDCLGPPALAGTPIVGLEPACIASLVDELPGLFPEDERAHAIARQARLLPDFLMNSDWQPPRFEGRRALVHRHCHHHSVMGFDGAQALLDRTGLDYELLQSGCCGMAGSFGFEHDHYDLAVAAGERVLLPAVRAAPADTLILTDGFSCREQIRQGTGRHSLHLADLLAKGLIGETP